MSSIRALPVFVCSLLLAACAPVPPPERQPSVADFDEEPSRFVRIASHRVVRGDPAGALDAAEHAVEEDPDSGANRIYLASRLLLEDDEASKERARAILAEERADHPEHPVPRRLGARMLLDDGRAEEALPELRAIAEERPEDPVAHALLATALVEVGDPRGAISEAQLALAYDPDQPDALRARARAYLARGDDRAAMRDARDLLRANPDDAAMGELLGRTLIRQGRADEARRALEAVPAERRSAEGLRLLASVTPDPTRSRAHLEAARELDPTDAEVYVALAQLERAEAGVPAAEGVLVQAESSVTSGPGRAYLRTQHASLVEGDGRDQEALALLRSAIEADPSYFLAYASLAVRAPELEGKPPAPAAAHELLATENATAPVEILTAILLREQSDPEGARLATERALALDPTLALAQELWASILLDRPDATAEELAKALDLATAAYERSEPEAFRTDTLGRALLANDRAREAEDRFRESLSLAVPALQPELQFHLAEALVAEGDETGARRALDRALKPYPQPRGGKAPEGEPGWVADARALRDRTAPAAGI